MNIQEAIGQLVNRQDLSQENARLVMHQIMTGAATEAQIGAYVTALRMKGETVGEIAGSAQAMRERALHIKADGIVVDTCGTGGDGRGSFNISSAVALVVAACGLTVAKHGNRSISSKSGSADVLKALGVAITDEVKIVEQCLREAGIGFLFAPYHHGAMKHAMGPRKELAIRTIFNLLGPLTNPAGAPYQLMGVYDPQWVEPLAKVLGRLGAKRAMVVHGDDGLDEITTTAPTQVAEWTADGQVVTYRLTPEQFGIPRARPEDLAGGDAMANAQAIRQILAGQPSAKRDIVLLNAGAVLYLTGQSSSIEEGISRAELAIDRGDAHMRLALLVKISNGG